MAETATEAKTKSKPEVEVVKMEDGREVSFVGKRKMLKETLIDGSNVTVKLDFRNGKSIGWTIPDFHLLRAAGHGGEQKLGDETAGEEDVDDMYEAVSELVARLNSGPDGWTTKREGGGFGGASVLMKALCEVTGKDLATVRAFLKAKVDAGTTYQKLNDAFSEDPDVGPVIKRLKKEKAGEAGIDTGSLKDGLKAFASPATA